MSGYPKKERGGEDGFKKHGRGSEDASPRKTAVGTAHSKSVTHALDGVAGGKGHAGRKASASGARPPGTERGEVDSRGSLKHDIGGGTPGSRPSQENPYGYDGEHSRGKHHGWKGNEAPTHPEAHSGVPGLPKHDHKSQMPARSGPHRFAGTRGEGAFRTSGHKGAHQLGKKR